MIYQSRVFALLMFRSWRWTFWPIVERKRYWTIFGLSRRGIPLPRQLSQHPVFISPCSDALRGTTAV